MASSSSSPCAACKFLRRKCTQECVFAPYFPPDQPQKFACVHKVFGASNVAKLLNELPTQTREDAVNSLYYEAEARLRDPVYGCVGLISILQHRLKTIQQEIENAKKDLASHIGSQGLLPIYNFTPPHPFEMLLAQTQNQDVGKVSLTIPTAQPLFVREQQQHNFQIQQLQQQMLNNFQVQNQNQNQEVLRFNNGLDSALLQPQPQPQSGSVTMTGISGGMLPSLALGTPFDYHTEQLQQHEVAAAQTLQTSETQTQTQMPISDDEENRRTGIGGQSLANFENK